jgi:S-adenosylmethionine decarboxylase
LHHFRWLCLFVIIWGDWKLAKSGFRDLGTHLILDAWGCDFEMLNDAELISHIVVAGVKAGKATLIDACVHQFSPHGVTATATLAESHIAIHTWPEHGYYGADLFFCGDGDAFGALESIKQSLPAKQYEVKELRRGFVTAEDGS